MSYSGLLSLPNEIIASIVDDCSPVDVASFAQCNTAIYRLCEPAIRRSFEARYSVIRLEGPGHRRASYRPAPYPVRDDHPRAYHPLLFLDQILSKPHIAQYPAELHIAIDPHAEHEDDDHEIGDLEETAALTKAISTWGSYLASLGANNPWFADDARRKEWRDALVKSTSQCHLVGILLTMLPNVESITITDMPDDAHPLTEIISAIAGANRDVSSPVYGKALARIHEVAFETRHISGGEYAGYFEPFAALPSMRSLYGRNIGGYKNESYEELDQDGRAACGQVEVIEFVHSSVDILFFERLLGFTAALRKFTYHQAWYTTADAHIDAPGIVRALAKHAAHSLERLELTAQESLWDASEHRNRAQIEQPPRIPNLTDFTKLRVLRIDDTLLQAPSRLGGDVARLVDVLPATIRVVRLFREMREDKWARALDGLAEEKERRLPNLKKVIIERGSFPFRQGMVDELERVGVAMKGAGVPRSVFEHRTWERRR